LGMQMSSLHNTATHAHAPKCHVTSGLQCYLTARLPAQWQLSA
jgi:hypothetical protein